MNFTHPSARYIVFLLSKYNSGRVQNESVLKILGRCGFPAPQDLAHMHALLDELVELRKEVNGSKPPRFNPLAPRLSDGTRAYLKQWQFEEAWTNSPAFAQAHDYATGKKAEVRRALCVALLGPVRRQSIADRLRDHFGLTMGQMNPLVVQLFEHYFWNTEHFDVAGWRQVFSSTWYPAFAYLEDFLTVLELPRNITGGYTSLDYALRSGAVPEPSKVYELMKHRTFALFLEAARPATKASVYSRSASMATLAKTYRDLVEEQERLLGGNSSLMDELRLLDVSYDDTNPKTFHAIPRHLIASTSSDTNIEEKPE